MMLKRGWIGESDPRQVRPVELERFSREPGACCMSYGFSVEALSRSVQAVGMVNPPLVLRGEGGPWPVVCGFRRVEAARRLGWRTLSCRVHEREELSRLDWLLVSLHENLATRAFNAVEIGMALVRLLRHLPPERVCADFAPLLGISARPEVVNLYAGFAEELEPGVKDSLASGRLSIAVARALLEKSTVDRLEVHALISKLRLSTNNQLQIIELIDDIAHKNGESMASVIRGEALQRILADRSLNGPQLGKAVLGFLRSVRYPVLTAAEKAFRTDLARLGLPKGVRVQAPAWFEADSMRLEIMFRDGRELRDDLRALERVSGLENLRLPATEDFA